MATARTLSSLSTTSSRTWHRSTSTSSFDASVLVVDSDDARALGLVVSFRLLGSHVALARTLDDGARLASTCDIIAIDDDAFGSAGVAFLSTLARTQAHIFRCAAARWSRFGDVRGVAQYVFAKPFSGAVVADAVSAARARHATRTNVASVVAYAR